MKDADGNGGGVVILAAPAQRQQRRATDIGGGVDENNKKRLIWGWRWRQRCCNVDLLTPGQAREGVYLGDFKKKKSWEEKLVAPLIATPKGEVHK
jgi:hypothetical protein